MESGFQNSLAGDLVDVSEGFFVALSRQLNWLDVQLAQGWCQAVGPHIDGFLGTFMLVAGDAGPWAVGERLADGALLAGERLTHRHLLLQCAPLGLHPQPLAAGGVGHVDDVHRGDVQADRHLD